MDDENKAIHIVNINCEVRLQYSFASHLSIDLGRRGISAFVNPKGNPDVIERASASVVVFSKNYLSSESNLEKLMRILECRRKNGLLVVPVFYGISPSDLVVPEHESADRISKWSSTLQELREIPGHQFRECSERELVEEIVKDLYEKLFPTEQIGINLRLQEIEQLLCKQPWGIRRIGIWGMAGIGKTTLARAFFDQISGGYEASCFIKHFDKAFHEKGLHRLLGEHFGKILNEMPRVCSSITRPSLPGEKLSKKRTLIVLDDVHNPLFSESFLGGIHWFGPGSLIIITSRDKHVFRLCQISDLHEDQSLNEKEALQLFYQCACVKDVRDQNILKLSMEVVDYANGNPLALRFFGGELKGKKLSEMETTFAKLKLRMPYKIYDLFKSSYETLNDNEKNIFLDIACFFKGENVDYVMHLLEGCGFFPHVGIDVLVEKCLVTISENRVKMHRIIQDFGREIINGETVQIERRRRLWEPCTIKFLLEDDVLRANGDLKATYTRALGTEDIEGIFLDTSDLIFDVKPGAFEDMLSLRFLKIYCSRHENHYGLRLPKGLVSLPYELRLLHWENYPLHSLPEDFDPCHLVELNLSYSQLQKLWGGTKNLYMLKKVRLCHSQQLTKVDDISKAQNIELIDLQGCTKLQSLPAMGQLQHLRVVNLSGCTEIRSFPEVSPNVEELHLQGTAIRELPISTVTLSPQVKLNKDLSNLLTEFPGVSGALNHDRLTSLISALSSNQHLGKLFCLNMKDCVHLRSLPHMADLESLKVLNLSGCTELDDIRGFPQNLKELYLSGTAIKEIPPVPWSVEILNAHGCVSLISIPIGLEQLPRYYTFSNCFALSPQVVKCFVKNALTNVERIAREQHQEQNLIKSPAFSFTVPSPAWENFAFNMQSGSSVMIQLGSSWRSTLGFVILVEVAFLENYNEDSGFVVSCVCRWKSKECVSQRIEKTFYCWTPGEGVPKDHMFLFCDLNMCPSTCEGNEPSILADLVVFEFFAVNKQKKLLDESCIVKKCGVHVITVAHGNTCSNMDQEFSLDYLQEISDNEIEEVSRVIYEDLDENDRSLFLYISCLFSDEEANFLASLVAKIGLGISSRLKVLASKSLIHISPCGIIVRHGLLQKIGRKIILRPSTLPRSSIVLDRDSGLLFLDFSSLFYIWKYSIFASFCEEDDCNNKISHLLTELSLEPTSTFKDKMKGSRPVGPELVEKIRDSKCSIVVLSKNYASSSWCLDELVEIMNCKKELAQKVVSIFYEVVPSDVRQLTGDFGRAFNNTCIGKSEDEKQTWVRALVDIANIAGANSLEWDNEEDMIEKLPHSFQMHSSMCIELKNFVERIMRIIPAIGLAQSAAGMQTLFMLYKALEEAILLLQFCSDNSKLYMIMEEVTEATILSRGYIAKKSLEQSLTNFRSMVPAAMAIKITQIIQDLRATVLTLESSEEEAGTIVREVMRRNIHSPVSSDAIRDFHFAALKLHLSTSEAIVKERRSLKSILAILDKSEVNKRYVLEYLLYLLHTHEQVICSDHKSKPSLLNQSVNDSTTPAEAKENLIFQSGDMEEVYRYLLTVDEVQGHNSSVSNFNEVKEASPTIQIIARVEKYLRYMLLSQTSSFQVDSLLLDSSLTSSSFASSRTELEDDNSVIACDSLQLDLVLLDGSGSDSSSCRLLRSRSSSSNSASNIREIDLVSPEAVSDLRLIAQRLIGAGYSHEFAQVYGNVRKSAMETIFKQLGIVKLGIGDVQRLEWDAVEVKVRRWISAAKICVRVVFASEKRLCEQIFNGTTCFMEIVKGSALELFSFPEAISISSSRSPEKLFKILDLHDALTDLLADMEEIFDPNSSNAVLVQATEIQSRLAEAVRGTLTEFESAVFRETSVVPVPGGTIHPLTRYVMNYLTVMSDYKQTLADLIISKPCPGSKSINDPNKPDMDLSEFEGLSAFSLHMIWSVMMLQFNLEEKSLLYKDESLPHIFVMNNVHYIVQKLKRSPELRELIGDKYLKRLTGIFRHAATKYKRATLDVLMNSLTDKVLHVDRSFSSGLRKHDLRDRLKAFNAMFENVHRIQKTWSVPDYQLRNELRISLSEHLIPVYTSFLERFRGHIKSERHLENNLKYTVENLRTALDDFFEG